MEITHLHTTFCDYYPVAHYLYVPWLAMTTSQWVMTLLETSIVTSLLLKYLLHWRSFPFGYASWSGWANIFYFWSKHTLRYCYGTKVINVPQNMKLSTCWPHLRSLNTYSKEFGDGNSKSGYNFDVRITKCYNRAVNLYFLLHDWLWFYTCSLKKKPDCFL